MTETPSPRPKIFARLEAFGERRQREARLATGSALVAKDEHMLLEDYLHITLLRRSNPRPLVRVQMSMLEDLVTWERMIGEYKEHQREREEKIARGEGEPERLKAELAQIEREVFILRGQCRVIRDLADGIAWRLFDYDRAVLYALADRPSAVHVELGGLESELYVWGRAFDEGSGIPVLNALTHFLKHGDVTSETATGSS